ncbi:cytochrome P450 [Mycena capillaripes]|nr:cytochrome P450 [Mycena capillaripes]
MWGNNLYTTGPSCGLSSSSMASTTIAVALFLFIAYAVRILSRRIFSPLDKVPGPARNSLIIGNLAQYYDPDGWEFQQELERSYGEVVKLHGLFGARQLFVFDPAALHSILVKDHGLYEEMHELLCLNSLLFGQGILSAVGHDHRRYRKIMVPAFSTANLRGMIPLFYEVAEKVRDGLIAPHVVAGPQTLDFAPIFHRTSLELIGRTGIGYSFDPMLPGQEHTDQYAKSLRALLPAVAKLVLLFPLLPLVMKIPTPSFRRFMIRFIPLAALHQVRNLVNFTSAFAARLVQDRKAVCQDGQLDIKDNGRDLMSLLIKSNMYADGAMHLTDIELVASTSMILTAATDTISASMNRILHILTLYPEVQEKLRAEIIAAPEYLDHDALVELPYLDAVVREVLRLYPPVSAMFRESLQDTILPLSTPVDGKICSTLTVPKGTSIFIGIAAANHSKRIWGEDALEFRPERWTNGKADSVTTPLCGIYGNTMTFLGGGRSCIGFKYAQLEMKVVLCVLLRAFTFSHPDPRIK